MYCLILHLAVESSPHTISITVSDVTISSVYRNGPKTVNTKLSFVSIVCILLVLYLFFLWTVKEN